MRCILDTLGSLALFLSLFATAPTPSNADPAGTKWIGCYVDSQSRVLSVWANGANNYVSSMTNEMCASECSGYNYFGTEAGTYCFCGNELIADAALAPTSTTCNNPCGGNNRETCGGAWLIDIYTYTGTTATTAIASSSSTPTSSSGGSSNSNGNGNGNGNGNSNSNTQTVNVGKSSADSLLSPSKITISVTIPIVVLALAGFLWCILRRRKRRLIGRSQSLEIANEPQNRESGTNGEWWDTKPELGATEVERQNIRQGRKRSIMAQGIVEVPNSLVPNLHNTGRNVPEVSDNSAHELCNTGHNIVEIPGNLVHELYDTQA